LLPEILDPQAWLDIWLYPYAKPHRPNPLGEWPPPAEKGYLPKAFSNLAKRYTLRIISAVFKTPRPDQIVARYIAN